MKRAASGHLRYPALPGISRRSFGGIALGVPLLVGQAAGQAPGGDPGFRLTDITTEAGLNFQHRSGASGRKLLPETMGAGCAFIDYDGDGWQDIVLLDSGTPLVDGAPIPAGGTGIRLFRNQRNGTFREVTREAGLWQPMYAMGVAVGDFNNDGFPDLFVSAVGQSRLFANQGNGTFRDVTEEAGLAGRLGFSTSAAWVDTNRNGLLDLFVCNYVDWSAERDIYCSVDGRTKSYCTPEAYEGSSCWLFRNLGKGRFRDATAEAGLFDRTSKALGVTVLDSNGDGWPDLFVANDTQPNKLYVNQKNGRFRESGLERGVALGEDGRARAGMGTDAGDLGDGREALLVTNFQKEMAGLFVPVDGGGFEDRAATYGLATATRDSLGFGCFFFDADLDGRLDLLMANGHIDESFSALSDRSPMAQPAQIFLRRNSRFVEHRPGGAFSQPRVARGAAYGDIDNNGTLDLLLTTNNGPARLFRNTVTNGNRSLRLTLQGTRSNRSAIGAVVRVRAGGQTLSRMVRSGSSYLSQSELPLTFGLGQSGDADDVTVSWPSGTTQDFRKVAAGRYLLHEERGMRRAG
jgi:enediyne biosynthesis protein E4